tara:strand:- start:2154 stop:2489 length:336 start_codon:yes stop_codon:yes gene_type:complete
MAACLCAGDLRHRISLQACSEARDEVGGLVATWTTLATVWAKVEPMSARESWYRQQMSASAAWKISVRYRADVTTKLRVVYGARTFEIRGVTDPDQQKRFLELACDEIVAP